MSEKPTENLYNTISTNRTLLSNKHRNQQPPHKCLMAHVIDNPEPLLPEYQPQTLHHREPELERIENKLSQPNTATTIQGPHGSGKTQISKHLLNQELTHNQVYISCEKHNTQYKILRQILTHIDKDPGTGLHTADLQRQLQTKVRHTETTIILDDIEFLMPNDGDSLLYYLSRLQADYRLLLTTAQTTPISLDKRTQSSLQNQTIPLEPYTGEQTYRILATRARKALQKQSLHREALTLIASTTQNLSLALTWLKKSAENTNNTITEKTVRQTQEKAKQEYIEQQLKNFTPHHESLYEAIEQALEGQKSTITGEVLENYREIVDEPMTDRQISTYLKDLEKQGLIQAEYNYGGADGKTRKINKGVTMG